MNFKQALARRQTNVESQIDNLAGNMSWRSDRSSREMCIDLIISVAAKGSVYGGHYLSRTQQQRGEAYEQLESWNGANCYHCGVPVTWKSFAENQICNTILQLTFRITSNIHILGNC
jgi:hypothetical protein